MKNPFYKTKSYFSPKKVTPNSYFTEIQKYFNQQFDRQLDKVNSVVIQAETFKEKTKLEGSTLDKRVKMLNKKFKENPTKLGVFKAKNDLAIELNAQILLSKESKDLTNDLKWFSAKKEGVDRVYELLDTYEKAFNNIEEKYRKGKIEDSFNADYNELKNKIPQRVKQIHSNNKGSKYKNQIRKELHNNLTNSYYEILNKATQPTIKKLINDANTDLSKLTLEGTDHPVFANASRIKQTLNSKIKIAKANQQIGTNKESLNKDIVEKKSKKKVTFSEIVDVRKVSEIAEIDIYPDTYHPSKKAKSAQDRSLKKIAETYNKVKSTLGSYKEVVHDFKQEAEDLQNKKPSNISEETNSVNQHEDSTMKISGRHVNSTLFMKSPKNRHVTIHHSNNPNYGEVPSKEQLPSTYISSIPIGELIKDPSKGTDNDRLILANSNKRGETLSYQTDENTTVTLRSTASDYKKGAKLERDLKNNSPSRKFRF